MAEVERRSLPQRFLRMLVRFTTPRHERPPSSMAHERARLESETFGRHGGFG